MYNRVEMKFRDTKFRLNITKFWINLVSTLLATSIEAKDV
jgi:hypothetical protein